MTIDEILQVLESKSAYFDSNGHETVQVPFPIKPEEYLYFAETDIEESSTRGLVNALSNAKRSLDARVDSVLIAFGLFQIARDRRWTVPKKLEKLSTLGVLTPRVLTKLNRTRNLIEHEFHCPTREQVEDFIDVVALFNESTRLYLFKVPNDGQVMRTEHDSTADFDLDYTEPKIVLNRGEHEIRPSGPLYERFVHAYAQLIQRWYKE